MNTKVTTRDIIQDTTPISEKSIAAIIDIVDYVEYENLRIRVLEVHRHRVGKVSIIDLKKL